MVRNFLSCILIMHMLGFSTQLVAVSPAIIAPAVYGQVQSIGNQVITQNKINQPILINIQSINNISGMEWDSVNNRMIVRHAGVYVILTDMIVGTQMNGDVYFWIERNGSPIFESGKKQTLSPQFETIPISNSWILPLDENDSIRFMFSATVPTVALITTQSSKNIPNFPTAYTPNSPGFNVTMFMLKK